MTTGVVVVVAVMMMKRVVWTITTTMRMNLHQLSTPLCQCKIPADVRHADDVVGGGGSGRPLTTEQPYSCLRRCVCVCGRCRGEGGEGLGRGRGRGGVITNVGVFER